MQSTEHDVEIDVSVLEDLGDEIQGPDGINFKTTRAALVSEARHPMPGRQHGRQRSGRRTVVEYLSNSLPFSDQSRMSNVWHGPWSDDRQEQHIAAGHLVDLPSDQHGDVESDFLMNHLPFRTGGFRGFSLARILSEKELRRNCGGISPKEFSEPTRHSSTIEAMFAPGSAEIRALVLSVRRWLLASWATYCGRPTDSRFGE